MIPFPPFFGFRPYYKRPYNARSNHFPKQDCSDFVKDGSSASFSTGYASKRWLQNSASI